MTPLWLLLKNLLYLLIVPGLLVGWLPLGFFARRPQWPALWGPWQWLGTTAALLGALVYLASMAVFAIRGHGTPSFIDPPKKLTRRGPYKWVRNPMYLALFALVAGEALFLRSWHIGIYFVFLVCSLHLLVVLNEENSLRFRFGAMYEDYRREVPRWRPRRPRPVEETVAPIQVRR